MTKSGKLSEYGYSKVPTKSVISEKEENTRKYGFGVRHIQVIILFFCFTVNVMGRAHFAVTIVAMTSNPNEETRIMNTTVTLQEINSNITHIFDGTLNNITNDEVLTNASFVNASLSNISKKGFDTYVWPKWIQEMLLNAFYLGYTLMMFPMGMVCQRYGGKLPLQISLIINAVTCVITPWIASWGGWKAVCVCRLIQGLSQTGTYPCTQALLSKWVPATERATLSSYVYAGMSIGTIIAYQTAGFLGASSWGWPMTFYTIGAIFFACFILLTVFGAASPMEHKAITEEEKSFIMSSGNDGGGKKMPWREIFTSKIIWALMITHTGSVIGYVFFFIQVPSYIHYILGVNVSNSGILSSLPYVASIFTTLGFGWLSDYCTNNKIVTLTNARKIFNTVAHFGIAIPLILTSYTSNTTLAVTLLVLAMAIYMGINCGWIVNYMDIAPNFSGSLTATGNTLANAFVVMTPIVVSYVVTDTSDVIQWRIMFFIIAAVMLITNTVYMVMGTAEIQPWNFGEHKEICVENPKENKKEPTEKQ